MQKNTNDYIPKPVDTTGVVLPAELDELSEEIAKHVHEIWSAGRMIDGWTYGECRDDKARKYPCLVPYDCLTEEEKDFDRRTSKETLKFILKLGFKISL